MKPSEALVIARNNIDAEMYWHICNALPYNEGGNIVRTYIRSALSGKPTYIRWLYGHDRFIKEKMTPNDEKEARLQWIDWMIKEYRRIGQ